MATKLRTIGHKLKPSIRHGLVVVREKRAAPFYLSKEWRALMAKLIKVRGRRCEDPKHDPSTPREGVRIFGDHIDEIRDGGPLLDPTNIMLRCAGCHARKTAKASADRVRRMG